MRHNGSSLAAFQAWLPGRILLPVGFAGLVAVSIYLVGDGRGYQRGMAEQIAQQTVTPGPKTHVEPAPEINETAERPAVEKADRLPVPVLVRAIEPDAVYRPSARAAHGGAGAASSRALAIQANGGLPEGVERFDRCGGSCDTRDPMIVRTSYPATGNNLGTGPTPVATSNPSAAAPTKAEGFFGLPPLPGPGEIVDSTVKGTSAAYEAVKNGTMATYDTLKGALGSAIGLAP